MSTGVHYSASQVETFELCPRKWARQKLDGLVSPVEKPSLTLGKAVHAYLEAWLRDGTPIDTSTKAGKIALSGVQHLPAPKTPGMQVEAKFSLISGGHLLIGQKDVTFEVVGKRPLVLDHKTTRNFRWAKSADDLKDNAQAALYAADAMFHAGAPECDLQWTYYRTEGGRASHVVRARVTREDIAPRLRRTVESCDAMAAIRARGLKARDIPMNASACDAFGGCEFLPLCNPTPEERLVSIMTQHHNAFLTQLKQQPPAINPPPQPVYNPTTGAWELPPQEAAPPTPPAPPQPVFNPTTGAWELPAQGAPVAPPAPPTQEAAPPAPVEEAPRKRGRKPSPPLDVQTEVAPAPKTAIEQRLMGGPDAPPPTRKLSTS